MSVRKKVKTEPVRIDSDVQVIRVVRKGKLRKKYVRVRVEPRLTSSAPLVKEVDIIDTEGGGEDSIQEI